MKLPKLQLKNRVSNLRLRGRLNKSKGLVFIAVFAAIGSILLFATRAATPFASLEPEQGTKTSQVTVGSDAAASGGQYVQFGLATPTSSKNCIANPSACGYPDATNTGVPTSTVLKRVPQDITSGPGWTYNPGGWIEVTGNGTVVEGINLSSGAIIVTANNVTIKNSYINTGGCGNYWDIRVTGGASNTLIQDVTLTSDETKGAVGSAIGVDWNSPGVIIRRANVSRYGNGVQNSDGPITVEDSYFHNPSNANLACGGGEYHNEAFQSSGGGNVTLTHNTMINDFSQTTAVMLAADPGQNKQTNDVVQNNLLAAGNYILYGGITGAGCGSPCTSSNIRIINNRMSRIYTPFSPITAYSATDPGNQCTGNFWDDDLTAISC